VARRGEARQERRMRAASSSAGTMRSRANSRGTAVRQWLTEGSRVTHSGTGLAGTRPGRRRPHRPSGRPH
jgi:hypothetical protein